MTKWPFLRGDRFAWCVYNDVNDKLNKLFDKLKGCLILCCCPTCLRLVQLCLVDCRRYRPW